MKLNKIISTVLIGAAAVTAASADITIKNQARIRTSAYSAKTTQDDKSVTQFLNLKNAAAADYLDFYANNEYAGVAVESVIDADPNAANRVTFDTYYGYLNFNALKFTFGNYNSRFTNRYNVTATEAGLLDSDIAKYGLSNKLVIGFTPAAGTDPAKVLTTGKTWLYDFGDVAQIAGGEKLSLIADYTLEDVAGGKLLLKAGLNESVYDTYTDSDGNTFTQSSGYVAEAAWQSEKNSIDVIFKNPVNKAYGAGAYFTTKAIDNAAIVLGVTYGTDDAFTAYAVDGRFQYKFGEKTTATAAVKFSSYTPEDADAETGVEAGLEVSYRHSDTLLFALDGRLDYADLDDNDGLDLGENTVTVSPRVKISAGPAAAITAAVEYTTALNASDDYTGAVKSNIAVPVIFRVKL